MYVLETSIYTTVKPAVGSNLLKCAPIPARISIISGILYYCVRSSENIYCNNVLCICHRLKKKKMYSICTNLFQYTECVQNG